MWEEILITRSRSCGMEVGVQHILFRSICEIGVFMICAQAIVHLRPRESHEKYLKLLVSAMVLIRLFLPMGSFLFRGSLAEAGQGLELFRTQLRGEAGGAAREAREAEKLLERMTLQEVRQRMEESGRGWEFPAAGEDQVGEDQAGEELAGKEQTRGNRTTGRPVWADLAQEEQAPQEIPEISISVESVELQPCRAQ